MYGIMKVQRYQKAVIERMRPPDLALIARLYFETSIMSILTLCPYMESQKANPFSNGNVGQEGPRTCLLSCLEVGSV